MSRTVKQPIGQKRLTNVAVVRVRKHGLRFEIACFKNKVLSWRSHVEKDLDEVLQTHTIFANVSKGVLAKSKDLIKVFDTDDEDKVCLEILEKGELQVADKERESQISNQFRDIATIVMANSLNLETERPYTITMIERLMREIHFSVDSHTSSKQQAIKVIRELQSKYSITGACTKLSFVVSSSQIDQLSTPLNSWNSQIEGKKEMTNTSSPVCKIDSDHFCECDASVMELQGTLEVVSTAIQSKRESIINNFNGDDNDCNVAHVCHMGNKLLAQRLRNSASISSISVIADGVDGRQSSGSNTNLSKDSASADTSVKHQVCNTCKREVGGAKQYRKHFKSNWHLHNLKRKIGGLPPLSPKDCLADTDVDYGINDRDQYSC